MGSSAAIRVHFDQLTDEQAKLLADLLPKLPQVLAKVRQQRLEHALQATRLAMSWPPSVLEQFRAEAKAQERWRNCVLSTVSWIPIAEAEQRCENTPWNADADLICLPHQGRRHVPLCQFSAEGPPEPIWPMMVDRAVTSNKTSHWNLMNWLLAPQLLLRDQCPKEAIADQPRRVLSLLKQDLNERKLSQ